MNWDHRKIDIELGKWKILFSLLFSTIFLGLLRWSQLFVMFLFWSLSNVRSFNRFNGILLLKILITKGSIKVSTLNKLLIFLNTSEVNLTNQNQVYVVLKPKRALSSNIFIVFSDFRKKLQKKCLKSQVSTKIPTIK